jgi:folate-binding protein YgfZ
MALLKPPTVCARCVLRRRLSTTARCRQSQPSSPPSAALPPPQAFARLLSRALIALHGPDAARFLHGLTTANIPLAPSAAGPAAIYSLFLNAHGRLLHDVFIYPVADRPALLGTGSARDGADPAFLIEVDAPEAPRLLAWLKRYKLRSKISTRVLAPDEVRVYGAWDESGAGFSPSAAGSALVAPDTRTPTLGARILLAGAVASPAALGTVAGAEVPEAAYTMRRYLQGVAEGQGELVRESALLQQSNVDMMAGVDFRKGCYVGQELVIRTQHTGVVRRRICPVRVFAAGAEAPSSLVDGVDGRSGRAELVSRGADVKAVGGKRSLGTWLAGVGNVGLALCRLEEMGLDGVGRSTKGPFEIQWEGGDGTGAVMGVKAFVPGWWAERREGLKLGF